MYLWTGQVPTLPRRDLSDDPDPAIGDKIREVHSIRFAGDPELVGLVEDLGSYKGSAAPDNGATR